MKLFFLIMLFPIHSFASEVLFYVHGGAAVSYKSDKIEISPDGKVKLTTLAPTFAPYPNMIGEFQLTLKEEELKSLLKEIKTALPKLKKNDEQPAGGELIEELHVGDEKRFWTSGENGPNESKLRQSFLAIAKEAYKNPVRALRVECSQKEKIVSCSYHNMGKERIQTVNPLGVTYSIQCLGAGGSRAILNKKGDPDPSNLKPERIKIGPGEKYSFKLKSDQSCDYRIAVKTTDLLINENYKDVLVGELVSDELE